MPSKFERFQQLIKNLPAKLKAAFRKKNNLALVVIIAAPVVILSVVLAFVFKPAEYSLEADVEPEGIASELIRHPLTGEVLDEHLASLPQVLGVMIENSADAWPLSGIDQAFLVIEAPVEGNIPRLLSFYSTEQEVEKIGPVRSARPYYLQWNKELDALYAHVGGSPQGLSDIRELEILDLNEFSQGEYFWRDNRRGAPHNVYTSTEELSHALEELTPEAPGYESWMYKVDEPIDVQTEDKAEVLSVVIDWSQGSLYDVKWRYQPETNDYLRLQNNRIVKTASNDQVVANNILAIAVESRVLDSLGRLSLNNLGEGDALLVQDGKIILGTWKKATSEERLRVYDAEGQELAFNAGTTWIEVVSSLDKVSTVSDL